MKLKHYATIAALAILPKHAAAEVHTENQDNMNIPPVEFYTDSISEQSISLPEDSIPSDSTLYDKRIELLRESKKDMLLLVAHFEAIEPQAYWDKVAKMYSVGLGFTRKKDGTKVTASTVIRSEEELMEYWEQFTEEKMFPYMAKYLKIEKTDHQERVALGCTAFNCGAGIYKNAKEDAPSQYAQTLNNFFETRDSIYLNKAVYSLKQRCTSRKVVVDALKKRRRVEADILAHKIILVNSDTINTDSIPLPENSIDLNKIIIGATCSIGALPQNSTELATKIREFNTCGYNVEDSIRKAFTKPITPVKPRKKRAKIIPPQRARSNNRGR